MAAEISTSALRRFLCFDGLDENDLNAALTTLDACELKAGETLFREGDQGDAVYLVAEGQIDITVQVPGAPPRVLSTLDSGAIFGEMSLLLHAPRAATAAAKTDATVWQITEAEFRAAIEREEVWVCKFLWATAQALAGRLSSLDRELVEWMSRAEGEQKVQEPAGRVAELERLRQRLFTEWSF